jgi:hypothetical protein
MTPKKILILAANPLETAHLRLDEEIREIDEGLRRSKWRDRFVLVKKTAVTARSLRQALLDEDPQIVHFSGHGAREDGLVLENLSGQPQLVETQALAKLFELFTDSVECILLNACYSQIQATAIAQHIGFTIGMNKAIEDRAAIEFALGFYDALGAGRTYDIAYKFACNAIHLGGIDEYLTPDLIKRGEQAPPAKVVSSSVPDFSRIIPTPTEFKSLIESRTKRFVGREFVTQAFDEFRQDNDRGYFMVLGEPGTGKSSIAANYVVKNQAICYFHIASQGNNTPKKFLNSIREQLIQRYQLTNNANGANLTTLINLVADKLSSNESLVIVVDALNEVIQEVGAENILFLPRNLPKNIYFFLTRTHYRTDAEKRLFTEIDTPQQELDLRQMKTLSQNDIEKCIRLFLNEDEQFSPKLQLWLSRNHYQPDEFIERVSGKVDDNFMYLVCLMDALTREQYANFDLNELPPTLKAYYHLHWERMGMNRSDNIRKKKILYLLKEVRQQKGNVYDEFISDILGIDLDIVDSVLTEWYQYLREEVENVIYYDFYHQSFFEYLTERKELNTEQRIFREVNEALNRHWEQNDPDKYQFN